jgi:hypothetical protein
MKTSTLENYTFDGFSINLYLDEQGDWLAHFQTRPNISAFGHTPPPSPRKTQKRLGTRQRRLPRTRYPLIAFLVNVSSG